MRVVIQRVASAQLYIEQKVFSEIGNGMVLLIGITQNDLEEDARWLAGKICGMRIFNDAEGIPNLSVNDVGGEILAVSQFTLHALTQKGNRPSYIKAARPEQAQPLYDLMISQLQGLCSKPVKTGVFGADMQIHLVNDGPFTILLDSKNRE
jgi:D-tyrosyl-tRNA(Tyr) deacylase